MCRAAASIIFVAFLAQPAVLADEEEVLTNEDILVMTEEGLAERVIVAKIMASETDFDITREQLVALSRAGVEAGVLEAMVVKSVPAAARRAPGTYAQRFEGTPCTAPGLYVEEESALRPVNPQVPQIQSGNNVLTAVTWGIFSGRAKAAIRGARSDTRTSNRMPIFWFCPEDSLVSANPGTMVDPREFLLVVLKASESWEERSIPVGRASVWAGGQSDIPPRLIRRVKYENVGFGVYRMTPRSALDPGEYGFYHAGRPFAVTGLPRVGKIFAFGVDEA